ncbi:MAG TPA: ABC transporter ATP-binding protein [Chloroflexota bacterium]|nr:ABC transporter ATP-binding protein [Chloroflexota bacterium]
METDTGLAIEFQNVSRHFGEVRAVDGVSFAVRDGEFFTLLGPSGSGKTTCLRMIAGFEQPTAGHILLYGRDVTNLPAYDREVNTVFQDYALFPHMTVGDNIGYGLMVRKVPKPEREKQVAEMLELVRLPGMQRRKPSQLSGGQRQRVALARALINHPKVLLLDEPLGALDLKLRQQMQVELKAIQHEVGITFIFVTHDQEEALTMSDRIAVFDMGQIVQIGAPSDLYERPRTRFVAGFVGTSNILSGETAVTITGSPQPFSVRPEKIRLAGVETAVPDDHCMVDGVVKDMVYVGMHTRYTVVLPSGEEMVVVQQNLDVGPQKGTAVPGQPVRLFWPSAANNVLEIGD